MQTQFVFLIGLTCRELPKDTSPSQTPTSYSIYSRKSCYVKKKKKKRKINCKIDSSRMAGEHYWIFSKNTQKATTERFYFNSR